MTGKILLIDRRQLSLVFYATVFTYKYYMIIMWTINCTLIAHKFLTCLTVINKWRLMVNTVTNVK